jgi:hypothetical protein
MTNKIVALAIASMLGFAGVTVVAHAHYEGACQNYSPMPVTNCDSPSVAIPVSPSAPLLRERLGRRRAGLAKCAAIGEKLAANRLWFTRQS